MESNTPIGSDESFISFAFAVTSVVLIMVYIPWSINMVRRVAVYYTSSKRDRAELADPLREMASSLTYIPVTLFFLLTNPGMLVQGAKICAQEPIFLLRCVMPKFLRFFIRPRIFVAVTWMVLLSSVMYASLTFNPHAVLGVPADAGTADIKRAYRRLTKQYHPDLNSTAAARDMYVQVRRAYKALIDRDAFEEEERKTADVTFGVALPKFLTNREHDTLVLFGLLGLLFMVPVVLYFKFFATDQKLPRLLWHVRFDKERVETFMKLFGVPEDPKYVAKRDSQRAVRRLLERLRIVPASIREDFFHKYPPFPDFVARCLEPERNKTFLMGLGLTEDAVAVLHDNIASNAVALVDQYEAAHPPLPEVTEMQLLSLPAYRATRYLFQQHTVQVDAALTELQQAMGGDLPSARRLLNLHEEMYGLLESVYEKSAGGKPARQVVAKLIDMPRRASEIVDSIEPEIEIVYRRTHKNYLRQMEEQRQQFMQMQKMQQRRAGAPAP